MNALRQIGMITLASLSMAAWAQTPALAGSTGTQPVQTSPATGGGVMPDGAQRQAMHAKCEADPQACEARRKERHEKMQERREAMKAKCQEDPAMCEAKQKEIREKMKERREAMRALCKEDKAACEAKRKAMQEKMQERKAERKARCDADPANCEHRPNHGMEMSKPMGSGSQSTTAAPTKSAL